MGYERMTIWLLPEQVSWLRKKESASQEVRSLVLLRMEEEKEMMLTGARIVDNVLKSGFVSTAKKRKTTHPKLTKSSPKRD